MDNDLEYLMNEIKADQKPVRPKRRKKKRRRGSGLLVLFLFVLLIVVVAGGLGIWWLQRPERKLPGHWHRAVEYTQEANLAAKEWLMAAEGGAEIDLSTYMGTINIGTDLILGKDGSWSMTLDEASYEAAKQQAYTALEQAFEDLLIARMQSAGREIESREEAAAAIRDTIGMDCMEYLKTYGPELLMPLEEMKQQYNGSGSWRAEKSVLIRDNRGEAFLINTDLLVLSGQNGTEVYYRNAD